MNLCCPKPENRYHPAATDLLILQNLLNSSSMVCFMYYKDGIIRRDYEGEFVYREIT